MQFDFCLGSNEKEENREERIGKYEDNVKKDKWTKNFKFSKKSPYVTNDDDLDLCNRSATNEQRGSGAQPKRHEGAARLKAQNKEGEKGNKSS